MTDEISAVDVEDAPNRFGVKVDFTQPSPLVEKKDDFNEYGVRERADGSLDVKFAAMEVGERKGMDITPNFLQRIASKRYSRLPVQLSHKEGQLANAGWIEGDKVEFNDPFLGLQLHIPNTGSSVRDNVIADFTHDPPAIDNGSVGFDPKTVKAEKTDSDDTHARFTDGRLREFSLTPFPGGYGENGGLTAAFSESVEDALSTTYDGDSAESQSQLNTEQRPYTIRTI